jgi:hypothetical protein
MVPQPMAEDMLLTGPLERTNQWYAIAKIAGIKLCESAARGGLRTSPLTVRGTTGVQPALSRAGRAQ